MKLKWLLSRTAIALLIVVALFGLASHDSVVSAQDARSKIEGFQIQRDPNPTAYYSMTVPVGTYDVTASKFNYIPQTITDVVVVTGDVTSQDFDLIINKPDIIVIPAALEASLLPDAMITATITISNVGILPVDWSITEVPGAPKAGEASGLPQRLSPTGIQPPASPNATPLVDVIADGSFEDGTPNSFWTEYSLNFGTPLCDLFFQLCGLGSGTGPRTGDWWAWFGGIDGTYEESYIFQDVTLEMGNAILSFWLETPACDSANDYLEVLMDGTGVFYVDGANPACGLVGYALQTVDLSAYADGGVHEIRFHSETFSTNGAVSNFFVDDVVLDTEVVVDVPWLSETPISGTVQPGESAVVEVTFDSTGLTVGEYLASLEVTSNDPETPIVTIPVTLAVTAPVPPGSATITGSESGLVGESQEFTAWVEPISTTIPLTYVWEADGRVPITHTVGLTDTVSFTWELPGSQLITVTASNPAGTVSDTHIISITDQTIEGLTASNDSPSLLGEATNFTATVTTGTNVIFTWDFGDDSNGNGGAITHTYTVPGVYTATVTATNSVGSLTETTLVSVITPIYPTYLPLVIKSSGEILTPTPPSSLLGGGTWIGLVIVGIVGSWKRKGKLL